MLSKIDWISFTIKRTVEEGDTVSTVYSDAMVALVDLYPAALGILVSNKKWKLGKGRKPYTASFEAPFPGIRLYVHPRLDHALFEISGSGCDWLGERGWAADFLEAIAQRLTRLDIAADMLTDTTPLEFAAERDAKRFKSYGVQNTESGQTVYIGSRTSNRFARVYRYNPPHERAHLLRVEVQAKHADAEYTARAILADGLNAVVVTLGEQFGWRHEDWQPLKVDPAVVKVWRPERGQGKTLYWLADTIAPLLVKLHNEGTIDVHDWFGQHILPKVEIGDRL